MSAAMTADDAASSTNNPRKTLRKRRPEAIRFLIAKKKLHGRA
jgi:hypothetical protein